MAYDKLYIHVKCTACRGTRKYSAGGYYNPLNPTKWHACPYCDITGKTHIEAVPEIIVDTICEMSPEKIKMILERLQEQLKDF